MGSVTFASECAIKLLERLAYQVNHTTHTHDADSVHDLRVATRRFAQSLYLFKAAFPAKEIKKIKRRLKGLMELTNTPRDCDVTLKLAPKSELPGADALEPAIQARRKEALSLLLPALRRWSARETSAKWRPVLHPNGAAENEVEQSIRDRVTKLLKRVLDGGAHAKSAHELHQARIAGKKLRYCFEILQPLYGERLDAAVADVKVMQTLLGDANDCHAARALIAELGPNPELDAWLKKRQNKKTREFREEWPTIEDTLRSTVDLMRQPLEMALHA